VIYLEVVRIWLLLDLLLAGTTSLSQLPHFLELEGTRKPLDKIYADTLIMDECFSYSDLKPILDSQTPESPASQTQTRHGRKLSTVGHGGSSLVVQVISL
jgi:hypothetical protein